MVSHVDQQRLIDSFFEMVAIESPSRHEAKMAAYCEAALRDLGFDVSFDDSAIETGADAGNLIARLRGTVPGAMVLSAHMDTVSPCENIVPVLRDGMIRSEGATILSADDKAGISSIIEGVRATLDAGAARPDIMVVLTTCEELHLLGAAALQGDVLPEGAPCYVLDADGAPGTIISRAPCHWTMQARFMGKAAHAGVEPEVGNSAIQMAAAAISSMPLGRIDSDTTANVGVIKGGNKTNVIPASCSIAGECRSTIGRRAAEQRAAMNTAMEEAAARFGGKVSIEWERNYDAILYEESDELVQGIVRAAEAAGLEPVMHHSGGGSDANVFAEQGVDAITLGVGMAAFHSLTEHIAVADLVGTARLVEALIAENAGAPA